ncbi:MFS transporter [Microbacterium aurum]|uniref:hypothetical protein n=1 Tax=Microbacterium aurum TaxID=36805 RepID=UPI0012F4AE1A|nr:hypothetical protein [Microbacterium aurum]MBM7827693.1 MFS family permease [Microbacterium aurum]
MWGASIPRLRDLAGVSDLELGVALLFVGAGALPAMFVVGRLLDRFGLWLAGPLLLSLSLAGIVVASTAGVGLGALCAGMTLVGATSGAADVALNSLAGRAEQSAGRPIITPVHATFSALVVVATLTAGTLNSLALPPLLPFGLVVVASAAACFAIVGSARKVTASLGSTPVDNAESTSSTRTLSVALILGLGALEALAFASENAHRSYGPAAKSDDCRTALE